MTGATTKVCSKCNKEKAAVLFSRRSDRPVGLSSCCKQCKSEYRSKRYWRRKSEEPEVLWVENAFG